jgi:3-methyladenine DNA glycosylase AlkC
MLCSGIEHSMAEALKTFFSRARVAELARSIAQAHPPFAEKAFVRDASARLDDLELLDRARQITRALKAYLPDDYPSAVAILLRSLGPEHATDELEGAGMAPFIYLPYAMFVAEYGLDDFDLSMMAQHAITRRFTCEWSIRAFLDRDPERTLRVLQRWVHDRNAHVRRLVSEGTRPRLPWAPRVKWIDAHPERILPLLEALKDDPTSLVRRSVANHLNDLSKTAQSLAFDTAERWLEGASPERRALVAHALRWAVKKGDRRALAMLGFGDKPSVAIVEASITPKRVRIGEATRIAVRLRSTAKKRQTLLVDFVVHFVKARNKTSPKVFKAGRADVAPNEESLFTKQISLAVHTTRKPCPGRHVVEALINGERFEVGAFTARA